MKYCFGVDIGGTTVKMGLFAENGDIRDKWEIVTKTEDEGKAILSRSKHEEAEPKPKFITIGEYVFNTELRTITKNEEQIKLTPKEARLLELLYNYKDGLLPREKALTEIWGTNDYFTARSMDVYVTKLRKYFKDDQNIKIENVHGSGFRLVIEE